MPSQTSQFIGIDCGRSGVKVVAYKDGQRFAVVFPAAVMERPRALAFDDLAEKTAADTVEIGLTSYWTGETALTQVTTDQSAIGRSDDWVTKVEHDVLILSAINRLNAAGFGFDPKEASIVIGVPSRVAKDGKDIVRQMTENTTKLLEKAFGKAPRLEAIAQPMGVMTSHCVDTQGKEIIDPSNASFLVVDVGQFTTDLVAVKEGVAISNAAESCQGIEAIAAYVRTELKAQGLVMGVHDLHRLMQHQKIKVRGQVIDLKPMIDDAVKKVLSPKIIATIRTVFGELLIQNATNILVAGGGAPVMIDYLKAEQDMPHAICVENYREAVADGYAKLAMVMVIDQ
jgi:plasmid segregation protein ParM